MDRIFDRLGEVLRSFLGESSRPQETSQRYSNLDPDMQEAWDELNAYLRGEEPRNNAASYRRSAGEQTEAAEREHLRADYATLEVRFAAPFEEVQRSYRKLLNKYHPDRNAQNVRQFELATEITKKINASFARIKEYESAGR